MLDIHSHILPGLDDGAQTLTEAILMAQEAVRIGVRTVIATPHAFGTSLDVDPDSRDEALAGLTSELKRRNIPLRVLPGFECFVTDRLVEWVRAEPRYLLPNGDEFGRDKYVLVEINQEFSVEFLGAFLFDCQTAGITPILAHPERHPEIRRNPGALESFVRNGGKLQLTGSSFIGAGTRRSRRACGYFMRNNLASFVASDAHCIKEVQLLGLALKRIGEDCLVTSDVRLGEFARGLVGSGKS